MDRGSVGWSATRVLVGHMDGYIDGLVQKKCDSIANTLELSLFCTNASIWKHNSSSALKWGHNVKPNNENPNSWNILQYFCRPKINLPDSKVHGAQHGAHLGPVGPRWAHVGPMNLAIRAVRLNPYVPMYHRDLLSLLTRLIQCISISRSPAKCFNSLPPVPHMYALLNLASIGSGNCLLNTCWATTWTNVYSLPFGHLGTIFSEIQIKMQNFHS